MIDNIHYGSELTEQQIQENYEYFIGLIQKNFIGERREKLLKLYAEENFGLRLATTPASGKVHFHYAHIGGYIQHVVNVERASRGVAKLYAMLNGTLDFTDEERTFAALHHDLGKLGDETGEYYVPQTEQWFIDKRGEVFKHNPKVQFWNVTDRAHYILQRANIPMTWKEFLAIKLSDGLYDESNGFYLKTFNPDQELKTNLPYIIHAADFLSCHAEHDQWRFKQ
jgi:hypothetical protein